MLWVSQRSTLSTLPRTRFGCHTEQVVVVEVVVVVDVASTAAAVAASPYGESEKVPRP